VRTTVLLLMLVGLGGHLYAAHAIGGSGTAYLHHVGGFVVILLVTGGVLAAPGKRRWRRWWPAVLITIGVLQAVLGVWIALQPASVLSG
jgi:hypothetical protein